jgi:hypothetical protein
MPGKVLVYNGHTIELKETWPSKHPGGALLLESMDSGQDITTLYDRHHTKSLLRFKTIAYDYFFMAFESKYNSDVAEALEINRKEARTTEPLLWLALAIYLKDCHFLLSALCLVVIGTFGHQFVHASSHKASVLTFTGFVSNSWRREHVYCHHPFTNSDHDIDLKVFSSIPVKGWLGFLLVSAVIAVRHLLDPRPLWHATKVDLLVVAYLWYDAYYNFGASWFLKHYIPAALFLLVDFFNHYGPGIQRLHTYESWVDQQMSTTQNFIFNKWLYDKFPYIHSLLTFGLDRQVEHHLFPFVRVENLSRVSHLLPCEPKLHVLGWDSFRQISQHFPV